MIRLRPAENMIGQINGILDEKVIASIERTLSEEAIMLIKKINEPNQEIIKEIREVELVCIEHDQLKGSISLDTSLNIHPEIVSLFLLYDQGVLVSFLSMFIPTSDEAEISAYTLPCFRRKGYFRMLLDEAIKEATKFCISDIVFICESQSKNGKSAMEKLQAEYRFTEYVLRYKEPVSNIEVLHRPRVKIYEAKKEDLDSVIETSQEIFHDSYDDAKSMILKTFESENRIQYMALLEQKLIGMASVCFENSGASIFGFGVSAQYRGKGIGGAILDLIIAETKKSGIANISIEVESTNTTALNLYTKHGFEVETSFDYYKKV